MDVNKIFKEIKPYVVNDVEERVRKVVEETREDLKETHLDVESKFKLLEAAKLKAEETPWYLTKKFRLVIGSTAALILNQYFGWEIDATIFQEIVEFIVGVLVS